MSIRFGDTLINREKFADVLDLAMGGSGSSTDGIITVYGGEECFPGTQITVKWGKFTIDLNGAELAFPGITLFDINRNANVTIKNGKLNLAGNTIYNDNPGIMDRSGGLTLEDVEIIASCNTSNGHVQYPAVKVLFNFSNPQTFTAKNVIFNGGFEARGSASITPFTNGSFVYSCPEATHENPFIKVGQNITDIIADGYALAKYDDNTQLVPMYQYDETGARVDLNEIWESVTVVPHPEHTFTNGVCGCGYRCEHAGGFDTDGICQSCGAHAVASVGDEMFTQLDVAFARANELSASTGENIKINILYDLGDIAGSGDATGKITLDLNGHDLRKCQFFVGKKDESGNVTAEGDLTIVDSGELTNGQIDKVTLYGGKLAVTDGYSMDIDVYGGEAFITDHIAENISVYGGTANLTDGSANDISVYKGKLNVSGSAVNRLFVNSDGKTRIFDGKITKATLRGGETTISDGRITDATLSDGELHITNGLTSNLLVSGGKAYISNESYGTAVPTFEMTAGEAYITGGNFDDFTVNITNADNTNPKLEIEDGTFGRTSFAAATQGRITLYGGIFDHVSIDVLPGSTVRTFGDILAENHMFYKVSETQAERSITLNGGEFTLDLNGYTVRVEAKTEPTHTTPYILLTDVDMTLKTSTVRNTYTSFYPIIQIYDGTVFKSSHDFTDSYLHIDEINFSQSSTTGKVSLGTGVYVVNLHKVNNQMTSGEVLEDGCVFRTSYGNTIIPRSDTSTTINKMFVIKCPHEL